MQAEGSVRLYSDRHYLPPGMSHVPLLSPFWGPAAEPAEWAAAGRFDAWQLAGRKTCVLVFDPASADVAVLPGHWNHYLSKGHRQLGLDFADAMHRRGVLLLVFFDSDSEQAMPFERAIVFRPSLVRSRRPARELPLPGWTGDLVAGELGGQLPLRSWSELPVVTFCGAVGPRPASLAGRARGLWLRRTRREPDLAHEVAAYGLRRVALACLETAPGLRTRFVRRRGYFGGAMWRSRWRRWLSPRGGAWDPAAGALARREYLENLVEGDYVVCVRGGGNFSYRFYEALCCGRIPILVDTDCALPFAADIPWREHVVWCDAAELGELPERVLAFHRQLSPAGFAALQHANRRLWEEWLSPLGFFSRLPQMLATVAASSNPGPTVPTHAGAAPFSP